MKERGIIFNTEMVKAILKGRKTVTRRPVKFELNNIHMKGYPVQLLGEWPLSNIHELTDGFLEYDVQTDVDDYYSSSVKCPFGQIGDRLYVRETWGLSGRYKDGPRYEYKAFPADGSDFRCCRYKSPAVMPKEAARIWLEITDIRVERVQDISNDQSGEEGMTYLYDYYRSKIGDFDETLSDRDLFEITWDSIYNNWNKNPWVWVIEFERIER